MATTIQEKQRRLLELLEKEMDSYDITQKIQFDWLANIKAQLDLFDDDLLGDEEPELPESPIVRTKIEVESPRPSTPVKEIPAPQVADEPAPKARLTTIAEQTRPEVASPMAMPMSAPLGRCATAPIMLLQDHDEDEFASGNSTVRFIDGDSLLDSSSDSDDCAGISLTSGSMKELTMSAASFRMKWQEMLDVKKACTNQPVKQTMRFGFESDGFYQYDGDPEVYPMTDDEEDKYNKDKVDFEIYEANPRWIHGKRIPSWARGRKLTNQMKLQKAMTKEDIDAIFCGFTADCSLPEIFKTHKPRWDRRNDSGWWDETSVPQEETEKIKNLLRMKM